MLRALRLISAACLQTLLGRLRGRPRHPRWPFVFELLVRYLRLDWDETADWDLARLRADLDRRPYPRDFAKRVKTEEAIVGGVPSTRFIPSGAAGGQRVLYLHGGSFIYGSARTTHRELIARLAHEASVEVVGLDYRLAPEHPHPAQIEDALAAFDALVESGIPASGIVLAGDSAGGNLALELQLALRDRGGPQAAGAALISPWSDLEMPGASFQDNLELDFGTREVLVRHAKAYAAGTRLDDPRLSPVRAELAGVGPCLVTAGSAELPRDDILALAERLEQAGVEVTLHVAADMPHNAPVFAAYHPEGKAAFDAVVSFVRQRLETGRRC